tara:strand:- start:595 stop:801 length:207 start_codon:yes stop_codon:yes gene_type:complete
MTDEQKLAVISLVDGICDVIKTANNGFPEGALYAYLMDKLTLTQFQALVAAMVQSGKISKSGNLLFAR